MTSRDSMTSHSLRHNIQWAFINYDPDQLSVWTLSAHDIVQHCVRNQLIITGLFRLLLAKIKPKFTTVSQR